MTTEGSAKPYRRGCCRRWRSLVGDARRHLYRQPVPAQFGRRDRAQPRRRGWAHRRSRSGCCRVRISSSFAAAQLPLGVALDRFGPKLCMLVSAAIAVIGCGVFALRRARPGWSPAAHCSASASSCILMAPLALYARRFPPERFSMLGGIHIGIGSLGTLLVDRADRLFERDVRLARHVPRRRRLHHRDRPC